jgi:ectoine hydroxylase-related dioxygenase (phytanoyl-CoA dioxygenase family)
VTVTEADVRTYRSDGVVCIRGAIAPEWIDKLRLAVDEAMDHPSELATDYVRPDEGRYFGDYNMWRRLEGFREFEFGSGAAEVAGQLMESQRIQLYTEHLLVKEPMSLGADTPWHQDAPYSKVKGDQFGSLWVAVDRATAATGVMQFAAGSQGWDEEFGTPEFDKDAQGEDDAALSRRIEQAIDRRAPRLVSYELEPGDCTFHHCYTLHRAGGNTTTDVRRRGLSLRFIGDDVRWAGKVQEGEDQFKRLNADLQLPAGSLLPEDRFPVLWRAAATT